LLSIGLTGNIAAGKSTVAHLFAEWGATVIDADQLVRELERPGTPVFESIVRRFGRDVVAADGTLDRDRLRSRVFAEPGERAALDAIVHPAVAAERERRLRDARRRGDRIVVSDIPLLFEVMDPGAFDAVVLVDAPVALRRERLLRSRPIEASEADAMIAAQLPSAAKRSRSTFVIDNDADLATLRERAARVWHALEARATANRSA
jgi:dephospho-CoA kinase